MGTGSPTSPMNREARSKSSCGRSPTSPHTREDLRQAGGRYPRWGPQGSDELFYVGLDGGMMAATV